MLPRHRTEIDRLDVQHYALREAVRGNHLAPVHAPATVLDVGAGTGQWAYDLCAEFPDAEVIGLDLVPSKSDRRPGNYRHRSEEHTSELQSRRDLVCRLLLE